MLSPSKLKGLLRNALDTCFLLPTNYTVDMSVESRLADWLMGNPPCVHSGGEGTEEKVMLTLVLWLVLHVKTLDRNVASRDHDRPISSANPGPKPRLPRH